MPYIICIAIMSGCSSGTDFLVSEIFPSMSTSIQHQLSVLMSSSCQFYNHGNQYTCQDQKYQKLGYHSRISHTWTPVFWIFSCFVVGFFTLPERHIYSPQELRLLGSTPLKKIKAHLPNPSCTDVGGFLHTNLEPPIKACFMLPLTWNTGYLGKYLNELSLCNQSYEFILTPTRMPQNNSWIIHHNH